MYTFFCLNTCSNYDDVGHFLCENISPNHAEASKYVELLPHTIVFPFEWQAQRRLHSSHCFGHLKKCLIIMMRKSFISDSWHDFWPVSFHSKHFCWRHLRTSPRARNASSYDVFIIRKHNWFRVVEIKEIIAYFSHVYKFILHIW